MRKIIPILVLLSMYQSLFAQRIDGVWLTNDLRQFVVNDTVAELDISMLSTSFKVLYKKDTLTLRYEYYRDAGENYLYEFTDYNFSYELFGKDSLEMKFLNVVGLQLDQPASTYRFRRKESFKKKNIKLNYLIFSSTTCMGRCPKLKIRINSDRSVLFLGEIRTEPYIGSFTGKLSEKQMDELLLLINDSHLDLFPKSGGYAIDAPNLGLTISYDNKILEYQGSFFPKPSWPLQGKLTQLYKEIELKPTVELLKFN